MAKTSRKTKKTTPQTMWGQGVAIGPIVSRVCFFCFLFGFLEVFGHFGVRFCVLGGRFCYFEMVLKECYGIIGSILFLRWFQMMSAMTSAYENAVSVCASFALVVDCFLRTLVVLCSDYSQGFIHPRCCRTSVNIHQQYH